jgi:hypothetical protein
MRCASTKRARQSIESSIRSKRKLKEQSDDGRRLRILKVETTEHGELKAKFAFLVKRSGFEEFRDAAETTGAGASGGWDSFGANWPLARLQLRHRIYGMNDVEKLIISEEWENTDLSLSKHSITFSIAVW